MTRSRWAIPLGLLLLVGIATGVWLLGPVQWQDALEQAERRLPPRPATAQERDEVAPSPVLVGRAAEAPPPAPPLVPDPEGDLPVRFVVAGTDSPVPLVDWSVRHDRLRAPAGGGWTFRAEGQLFEGTADRDGRAVIPAVAVAAWRTYELFASSHLFQVEIVDRPVRDDAKPMVIPLRLESDESLALRRYEGFVIDEGRRGIPGALLQAGSGSFDWWARADAVGHFDVTLPVDPRDENLPLIVVALGYLACELELPIEGAEGLDVPLDPDDVNARLVLRLRMPDGQPAAGAWVRIDIPDLGWNLPDAAQAERDRHERASRTISALSPWFPREGRADGEGRFVLAAVSPGMGQVRVSHGALVAHQTVEVHRPETTLDVDLYPGRTLRGVIGLECVGRCRATTHRVRIKLKERAERTVRWKGLEIRLDGPGPFEIAGVPPVELIVEVDVPGHPRVLRRIPATQGTKTVDAGEIVVPPGRFIQGTAHHDDGIPVERAYLRIRGEGVPDAGGWVSKGTFRVARVWRPTSVRLGRMPNHADVDVTDQVDLNKDTWTIRLPPPTR